MTRKSASMGTSPRYPWSLLSQIAKKRLMAASRAIGHEPEQTVSICRLAEELKPFERRILNQLTIDELKRLARTMMVSTAGPRSRLMRSLLKRPAMSKFRWDKYPDHPEQLDDFDNEENDTLRIWAENFIRQAELMGEDVDFDPGILSSVAATVRLVSEVWGYIGWPDWLEWQTYAVSTQGAGYILDFEGPGTWFGARVVLNTDPWDFSFATLCMDDMTNEKCFSMRRIDGKPISISEYADLGRAVVSGMREEFDDGQFAVLLERDAGKLWVHIVFEEDDLDTKYEPNPHGFMWVRWNASRHKLEPLCR